MLFIIGVSPKKREFRTLSRSKSKKHLKYQAPNILYMINMLGAFVFGNEFWDCFLNISLLVSLELSKVP